MQPSKPQCQTTASLKSPPTVSHHRQDLSQHWTGPQPSLSDLNIYNNEIGWDKLGRELEADWSLLFKEKNTSNALNIFLERCLQVCKNNASPKRPKNRKVKKHIPRDRKVLKQKRSNLRARLKMTLHSLTITKLHKELEEIERNLIILHEEERTLEEL